MVSRATLTAQIGQGLKDRAREFSGHLGKPINARELRSFYRGRGITMQKPRQRLGPDDLGTPEEQLPEIQRLQEEVKAAEAEGREIISVDEAIFSSKGQKRSQWAPVCRPPQWDKSYYPGGAVAVCAGTSRERGLIHWKLRQSSFKADSFFTFLKELRSRHCERGYIAILLDNQRLHKSEAVTDYCNKFDIELIWNVKARPDFNGVEFVWDWAKRKYRSRLDHPKANGEAWDQQELVAEIMESVPTEAAKERTGRGFKAIVGGETVRPDRNAVGPKHDLQLGDLKGLARADEVVKN